MKRTQRKPDIPALVADMEAAGCTFFFNGQGSLWVRDLARAPGYLRDLFYDCEAGDLVKYLRRHSPGESSDSKTAETSEISREVGAGHEFVAG